MPSTTVTPNLRELCANTVRMLAVDAVEKANSGHPGAPMGMADMAVVLWTRFLRFNPQDPQWINRDRFVLSAGHASMLLYSLLHLSGFDLPMSELQAFRQWDSRTPGHPEYGHTAGVEVTTGPLGQGFAHGVGMALGSKMLGARFNTPDFAAVDHYVYGIVSDGDLMEGVSAEAASLAGHLGLGNLIYLYDDNNITIEGTADLAMSEDVAKRFEAYGWHVQRIDGHDHDQIEAAILAAQAETAKPSLIIARTTIGKGAPTKQNTAGSHGSPLGKEEIAATKKALGWPEEPTFLVPDEVRQAFGLHVKVNQDAYAEWQKAFEAWKTAHPEQAAQWQAFFRKDAPADLTKQLLAAVEGKSGATRSLSGAVLQKAAELFPSLVGGSADLEPSNNTLIKGAAYVHQGEYAGRNFHFGVREHAMGSIVNGLALEGGFRPYGATFLIFSDYMRPAIRLAALMNLPVFHVLTHDSIFLGEDGPTHQPVEHLSSLRAMPNLTVWRPADALEVAMTYAWVLGHATGPSVLSLTRQKVANLDRPAGFDPETVFKGGYVVREADGGRPDLVLIGTGSEVEVALAAAAELAAAGRKVRVVSMPSLERFEAQDAAYQEQILPAGVPTVAIEAAHSPEWYRWVGRQGLVIGLDRFGASAPAEVLAEKLGFTGPKVAERVKRWLSQ